MNNGLPVDPEEDALLRGALDSWDAPQPPAGFAHGVMRERARQVQARQRVLGVGGLALAAGLLLGVGGDHFPLWGGHGAWNEDAAQELDLHWRARVAARSGAALSWTVEPGGRAHVKQDRGGAFYRVEKGGDFEVTTPWGVITVQGTCFDVSITSGENDMLFNLGKGKHAALGALGGSLLTGAVLVTVYEGKVALGNPAGTLVLAAGESGKASGAGVPPGRVSRMEGEQRRLLGERDRLRQEVEDLEGQLRAATAGQAMMGGALAAENAALKEQLKGARASLAAEKTAQAAQGGLAVPWPKDLPQAYQAEALQRSFGDAIKAAGLDGEIKSMDCTEFPCLVWGKATHHGDKATSDAEMKRFETALNGIFPEEGHSTHGGVWSSSCTNPAGKTEQCSTFAYAVYPSGTVDTATRDLVRKRMRYRTQQYMDGEENK